MPRNATEKARALRTNQTKAEKILWQHLRRSKLGAKFRRQQPLRLKLTGKTTLFITDFYCPEAKLVIELDGKVHENQLEYDAARDQLIGNLGIHVMRFTNGQVESNIDLVLAEIQGALAKITKQFEAPLSPGLGKGGGG